MASHPLRILAPDGTLESDVHVDSERVRELYEAMVTARAYDLKGSALQRQGRLATYAPFEGQEAAQIGAVACLERRDWVVATYRDAAAMQYHGYPWHSLLLARMGDERGGHPPAGVNVMPPSITVGGHMIHAVGISWAEKLKGTGAVAVTLFGDGATSEGDFHEAMNFAGVYELPTVFVCENNGWAISMPRSRQTSSETIAQKADAYGFEGVLVDGNDVIAVDTVVSVAVQRARDGGGPTLVEALTYRIAGHTTADDHGRYRAGDDVESWRKHDPLDRVRRYLTSVGAWDDARQAELEERAGASIEEAVEQAESYEPPALRDMFDAMYAEPTATLTAQRAELEAGTT